MESVLPDGVSFRHETVEVTMRQLLVVATITLVFICSASAQPSRCKLGETITLEGEIIIPPVIDGGEWFWPGKFAQIPCQVATLRGKGALPDECRVGKRMTLTGRVTEDGILTLQVERIRCY